MGPVIAFEVLGIPVPKGSMKAFLPKGWKRPIVTADNRRTKPWQEAVTCAAADAMEGQPPLEGPVALYVRFFLPRPKSAPKRIVEPAKTPDVDKLLRAVADGLTRAGVWRDDAQVTLAVARKEFAGGVTDPAGGGGIPRAVVEVGPSRTHIIDANTEAL